MLFCKNYIAKLVKNFKQALRHPYQKFSKETGLQFFPETKIQILKLNIL